MASRKIGEIMSGLLDMPKDVVMDVPKIIMTGDMEVFCGGYKSLFGYSESEIKCSAGDKIILIKGQKLMIKTIENEEIIVTGRISAVEFL